jgi:hypothetical protein
MSGHHRAHLCRLGENLAAVEPERVSQDALDWANERGMPGGLEKRLVIQMETESIAQARGLRIRFEHHLTGGKIRRLTRDHAIHFL